MTPGIANDLLVACDDIGMGRYQRPDLLGKYRLDTQEYRMGEKRKERMKCEQ